MITNKKTLAVLVAFVVSQMFVLGAFADTSYRVKSSDNLNKIAEKHYEGSGLTKSQILVGLYASNPKAFKNGNINKLLRGKKLVLPDVEKIDQISDHEAELVLSARTKSKKVKKRRSKKRTKSKRKRKVRSKKKVVTKRSTQIQANKSNQKINKLEKESESLRKRLDALLAEKSASDNKLKELESSLQKVLKKSAGAATAAAAINTVTAGADVKSEPEKSELETKAASESEQLTLRANEKLRETNTLLEKNLQESKKEIADRTRENLAKEHAIKTAHTPELQETSTTFDTSNKYLQWALLSLLLFPLIWFAKRLMGARKAKEQPAWVAESQGGILDSSSEHIDTHYQEAPVESSIKLDVASAYLESGNTDEAMELLNEIMVEGNAEQQAQAQDLLNQYS